MQNWDSLPPANYEHNWYGNMFPVKTEPQSSGLAMDHYLGMKQTQAIDMSSLTPSPRMDGGDVHNFLDNGLSAMNNHHPLGFNPLTPPGLPNAVIPSMNYHHEMQQEQQNQPIQQHTVHHHHHQSPDVMPKIENNSLTPRNTPPMDVTPPKSPKMQFSTETPDKDNELTSNSSEDTRFLESEDDESIRMPIYNSHGKMKNYKCKHCGFLAITKVSFWNHVRVHMKPEKILQCPKCPFVTELKHHLEYHIRKHKNLKPFQCDKCNYSCVNKSMLNSHLKSHSSVYQYRCSDCDYATKYCHSFKLHLRKYDHKPGLVLDEDGAPNPSVVIDVYGTRRGPKMKGGSGRSTKNTKQESKQTSTTQLQQPQASQSSSPVKSQLPPMLMGHQPNPISSLLPNTIANMLQQSRNMPFFPYLNLNLQMIAAQHQAVLAQLSPRMRDAALHSLNNLSSGDDQKERCNVDDDDDDDDDDENDDRKSESSAMDLSQTTPTKIYPQQQRDEHELPATIDDINTPTITSSSSSRRKGRVLKLDSTALQQSKDSPTITNPENPAKSSVDVDCTNRITEAPVKQDNSQSDDDDNEQPLSPTSSSFEDQKFNIVSTESADSQSNIVQQQQQQHHHQQQQQQQLMAGIFECKYCDIYFKDAVLYTIHMGYHSCDDVFKCNMCGEKCDGPVGLFVHMARNAHS